MISVIESSGLAGAIGSIFTNPFYVLQTRQSKGNKKITQILAELIEKEGVLALFKGLLASLILISNPIIQFVVYEWLKKRHLKSSNLCFMQERKLQVCSSLSLASFPR